MRTSLIDIPCKESVDGAKANNSARQQGHVFLGSGFEGSSPAVHSRVSVFSFGCDCSELHLHSVIHLMPTT